MKIGIIGAENSHTVAIAKVLNVSKLVKGFSIDYVWGETEEVAKAAAQQGHIAHIVSDPREMLGNIDALIVDHRHAKYHLKAALPFVKRGIPTFIDKPFCCRAAEGRAFLETAKKAGTPVTSFSVLSAQARYVKFIKRLAKAGEIIAGTTFGPCDVNSPYGGIFFYGIHQVDMALNAFGYDVSKVLVTKHADNALAQLMYDDGKIVTLHLVKPDYRGFVITADTKNGIINEFIQFDADPYLKGIKTFTKMFKTRQEPISHALILRPVEILEAMEKSIKSGKVEKL